MQLHKRNGADDSIFDNLNTNFDIIEVVFYCENSPRS